MRKERGEEGGREGSKGERGEEEGKIEIRRKRSQGHKYHQSTITNTDTCPLFNPAIC